MKKFLVLLLVLVLVLTACVASPTKTPTAVPTDVPPAEEPTDVPAPTEEPTEEPTEAAPEEEPTAEPEAPSGNSFGSFEFTDRKGGGVRTGSAEFSVGAFARSCDTLPDELTLTVTANESDIYKVNYVYRLTSATAGLISTGWSGDAKMEALGDGKFQVTFPADQIPSEAVTWDAWFDVQFIAFDEVDITYSSPIFAKVIKYTYECP